MKEIQTAFLKPNLNKMAFQSGEVVLENSDRCCHLLVQSGLFIIQTDKFPSTQLHKWDTYKLVGDGEMKYQYILKFYFLCLAIPLHIMFMKK